MDASSSSSSSASASPTNQELPMDCYFTRSVSTYETLNRLGEGTYGTVYRARDRVSGEIVALKKLRLLKDKTGFPLTSIREIKLLLALRHPNIVSLLGVSVGKRPDSIYLVFEYCEHDFAAVLEKRTEPFSESQVKTLMLALLEAVNFLHQNFIIHRDLKLSNLLMNSAGVLKLADFGLARIYGNPLGEYTPKVVTLWYRSPELLLGQQGNYYHSACDIWSIGCIFAELLNNKPLMPGKTELGQLHLICHLLGTPNERIWPSLTTYESYTSNTIQLPSYQYNSLSQTFPKLSKLGIDLLSKMLTYDPSKRITAKQCLLHPYFKQHPLPTPISFMPTPYSQNITNNAANTDQRVDNPTDDRIRDNDDDDDDDFSFDNRHNAPTQSSGAGKDGPHGGGKHAPQPHHQQQQPETSENENEPLTSSSTGDIEHHNAKQMPTSGGDDDNIEENDYNDNNDDEEDEQGQAGNETNISYDSNAIDNDLGDEDDINEDDNAIDDDDDDVVEATPVTTTGKPLPKQTTITRLRRAVSSSESSSQSEPSSANINENDTPSLTSNAAQTPVPKSSSSSTSSKRRRDNNAKTTPPSKRANTSS